MWVFFSVLPQVCSTYPPEIVVPRAATKAVVMGSSRFRSRGRIPVLSYLYKENNVSASLPAALGGVRVLLFVQFPSNERKE